VLTVIVTSPRHGASPTLRIYSQTVAWQVSNDHERHRQAATESFKLQHAQTAAAAAAGVTVTG